MGDIARKAELRSQKTWRKIVGRGDGIPGGFLAREN